MKRILVCGGRDSIPWLVHYGGNPKQTTWPWECTVKAKDVTPELIKQLEEDATKSLASM